MRVRTGVAEGSVGRLHELSVWDFALREEDIAELIKPRKLGAQTKQLFSRRVYPAERY